MCVFSPRFLVCNVSSQWKPKNGVEGVIENVENISDGSEIPNNHLGCIKLL